MDEHTQTIAYTACIRPSFEPRSAPAPLDPRDFLARVVMHIPGPHRHLIRSNGAYFSVMRARRRREGPTAASARQIQAPGATLPVASTDPELRRLVKP